MKLLLDTNIVSRVCHPAAGANHPVARWFQEVLEFGASQTFCIPEIVDYEVRRGLQHIALKSGQATTRSLLRLDLLTDTLEYLPLNTRTFRRAAGLWAESRYRGQPTASPESLDGDVILAAQALDVGGQVVTENVQHLSRYVKTQHWKDVLLPL